MLDYYVTLLNRELVSRAKLCLVISFFPRYCQRLSKDKKSS